MPPMPPRQTQMPPVMQALLRARMQQAMGNQQRPSGAPMMRPPVRPTMQGMGMPPQAANPLAVLLALRQMGGQRPVNMPTTPVTPARRGEAAKPAAKSPVKGKAQASKKAPASKKKGGK